MDTDQWPQEIGHVKPMEEMISSCSRPILERRMRPQKEQALNCPRCNSTNTKFCYYNNYSLSQPRYFCKTCRRYWTEGGSLRNVPVGGGSRKNKRSSSSSSSSKKNNTDLTDPTSTKIQEGQDLNLAFPNSQEYHHGISADHVTLAIENNNNSNNPPCSSSTTSALELLRSGFGSRSLNPYMATVPDPNTYPSLAFGLHDFNRSNFNVPGFSGYGNFQESGKVLFPFEDLRQVSSNTDLEESKVQGDSTGYWSGMLGGGSWSQVPNYGP